MSAVTQRRLSAVADLPTLWIPYVRISALMYRDLDGTLVSDVLQLDAITGKVNALGGQLHMGPDDKPYADYDKTGLDFNRLGLKAAMNECARLNASGRRAGIVVYNVSRFGRNAGETLTHIKRVRGDGGLFASAQEQIDDTPAGEMMLAVFAAFAEFQANTIAMNWRAAKRHAVMVRGEVNGPGAFGYHRERVIGFYKNKNERRAGHLIPNDDAKYVIETFNRYDSGETASSIDRDMQKRGVWKSSRAKDILGNPLYIGWVRLKDYAGAPNERRAVSDWNVNEDGAHSPIITTGETDDAGRAVADMALWERVQKRLTDEARTAKRHINPVHSLGGLIRCVECNRSLVHNPQTKRNAAPYFRDNNGMAKGCPGAGGLSVADVEAVVKDRVAKYLDQFAIDPEAEVAALERRTRASLDVEEIDGRITETEKALGRLAASQALGRISDDAYNAGAAEIERMLAALKAQREAAALTVEAPAPAGIVEAATELLASWDTATGAERNRHLKAIVRRVTVRRGTRWREPADARIVVEFIV